MENEMFRSDKPRVVEPVDVEKLRPADRAHYPNQVFSFSDGREYTVNRDGSWIKTKEELKGGRRVKANR